MSEELDTVKTLCTPEQMAEALSFAWIKLFNEVPRKESICILLAQWALETGWGKACYCWNIGNYKHVDGDNRDYCYYKCNEIIGGRVIWFDPTVEKDRPYCCFRAYKTIEAGAIDYVASLHKRFTLAWPDVVSGDPAGFAHDLKRQGYYTANEEDTVDENGKVTRGYKSSIVSIFRSIDNLSFDPSKQTENVSLSDEEKTDILNMVAITINSVIDQDLKPGIKPEPESTK